MMKYADWFIVILGMVYLTYKFGLTTALIIISNIMAISYIINRNTREDS